MSLTAGQLKSGINVLADLVTALQSAAASNFTNLPDDAVVLEDGLNIASIAWPPAASIAIVIELLVGLEPIIASLGISIKPDPNPIADAQTTQSRGGRNG